MNDFKIFISGFLKFFTIWWPVILAIAGLFIYLAKAEKETEKNRQAVKRAVEKQRRAA